MGCAQEETKEVYKAEEWTYDFRDILGIEPYKDGVYYRNIHDKLSYFDVSSKKVSVLCDKKGCAYDSEACHANLLDLELPNAENDHLYKVTGEGKVFVSKLDNTQEKEIMDLGAELLKEYSEETNLFFSLIL